MSNTNELTKLQLDLLERIMFNLNGLKLTYAIRMPDGTIKGDLESVLGRKVKGNGSYSRRRSIHPIGQLKAHIDTYIADLQPGEVAYVPFDKFDPYSVQSMSGNTLKRKYPECKFTTTLNRDKNCVEVMYEVKM